MLYLYIKQHSVTGLKYFGKITKKNPFKYHGSGKYWLNHINMHGKKYIQTLEIFGFDSQELCTEFALKFSKDNNIIESREWANLKEENGQDGIITGHKLSDETKLKMSKSKIGIPRSKETKLKISLSKIGKVRSKETKLKISESHKGKNHCHSYQTRLKMSESHKGKTHTEQTKIKMSKSKQHISEEYRRKMSLAKIGKKWYNNGVVEVRCNDKPDNFSSGRLINNKRI